MLEFPPPDRFPLAASQVAAVASPPSPFLLAAIAGPPADELPTDPVDPEDHAAV